MKDILKFERLSLLAGFVLACSFVSSVATAAGNLDAQLRGSYAFTSARTCTFAREPFDGPNLLIPNVDPATIFRQTATDSGIYTFNGDGTGTIVGRSTNLNTTATTPGTSIISVVEFTTNVKYSVNEDRTVDVATAAAFTFVFPQVTPPVTGTTEGQTGRLQIAHGNTMLVTAPGATPTMEIIKQSNGFIGYRLCVRDTVLTKLTGD
jgi:hypothetical protein